MLNIIKTAFNCTWAEQCNIVSLPGHYFCRYKVSAILKNTGNTEFIVWLPIHVNAYHENNGFFLLCVDDTCTSHCLCWPTPLVFVTHSAIAENDTKLLHDLHVLQYCRTS